MKGRWLALVAAVALAFAAPTRPQTVPEHDLDALLAAGPDTAALEGKPLDELLATGRFTNRSINPDEAEPYLLAGARVANRLDDRLLVGHFLSGLADIERWRGRWLRELAFRIERVDITENRAKEGEIADECARIAALHIALGQPEQAQVALNRALGYWTWHNDWRAIHACLLAMGDAYRDTRADFRQALGFYVRARDLARDAPRSYPPIQATEPDPQGQRGALLHTDLKIGQLYRRFGQVERSLTHYRAALENLDERGMGTDRNLLEIADAFAEAGAAREAEALYLRAIRWTEARARESDAIHALEWRMRRADALQALGSFYFQRDQTASAEVWLNRALALFVHPGQSTRHVYGLLDRGELFLRAGHVGEAGGQFQQAVWATSVQVRPSMGYRPDLAIAAQLALAKVHVHNRDLPRLQEAQAQILRAVERITDPLARLQALVQVARSYEGFGDPATARRLLGEAEALLDAVLPGLLDPAEAPALLRRAVRTLYARLAALLAGQGDAWGALATLDRGRGRGLALQAAQAQMDLSSLRAEDRQRLQAARLEMADAGRWRRLAVGGPRAGEAEDLYRRAEEGYRNLLDTLRARSPGFRRIGRASPASVADLKALLTRSPETLFVTWAQVEGDSWLLVAASHRTGVRIWRRALPDLEKRLGAWRRALLAGMSGAQEEHREARACFTALLGPLDALGLLGSHRRLVLVPEGELSALSFAALEDGAQRRLIERVSVSVSLSLSVLTWRARPPAPGSLLVVANPLGPEGALPYGQEEARKLLQLFPGARSLTGPSAREEAVKKAIGQYRLLHFITHGAGDEAVGLRSWLALGEERAGSLEDGHLEAREITETPLAAQLAVLSACESGQGVPAPGEGVQGFAWAFRAAGCPATVASLWPVEDAAASRLMAVFYAGLRQGRRKDDALRKAMLSVRRDPWLRRPQHWAVFQLFGDSAPVSVAAPSSPGGSTRSLTRFPARR